MFPLTFVYAPIEIVCHGGLTVKGYIMFHMHLLRLIVRRPRPDTTYSTSSNHI